MDNYNPFQSINRQLEIINRKLDELQSTRYKFEIKNNEDETLTVDEVCQILKVRPATIYGKTCRNTIPFTKQGKRLVFFKADILRFQREGYRPTNDEIEKSNVENLIYRRKKQ
jgi:excisionase family DNA binding protein